ncbi:endonuclease/exonuclease/phosphatase family protein [Aquipseudomonas ullengensis]|uniref:Endonuclease/exonuclease/phosphatase family protein n=1 Tax=Aquipseudomonas ullengensis TaxID=2759166 RepID=A0A7W4LI60_9GAMM|nr:endonuclease/exonuclease/phosphatase family protein [Pseudomonas ullengensis]MBB2493617.1 endonuclease/exonuclease/phosphatase family protein [Pseudomonas ullengensis]
MSLPRPLRICLLALTSAAAILVALIYCLTWHPAAREEAPVACHIAAPILQPGQAIKVMTWNLQSFGGKGRTPQYQLEHTAPPTRQPSASQRAATLDQVVRILRDEQPDVLLLQELQDGARASDYEDQLALLMERLSDLYPCRSEAFYWRAAFVPHPRVMGSVGMKLATLSRFQMSSAERLQLPQAGGNPLTRPFGLKHALLVSHLPLNGGGELVAINSHLDGSSRGDDTLYRQVEMSGGLLEHLEQEGTPWVFGGDLNLLAPGQYPQLTPEQRSAYAPHSELSELAARFPSIPNAAEASGAERQQWYTYAPDNPRDSRPDRTLDHLLHSPRLHRLGAQVRNGDTRDISDHLPLSARLLLPLTP